MSNENRVLWAQILGLFAIVAARFGIDITAESQADILAGLSAFGLLLTAVLAKAKKPAGVAQDKQAGRASPYLLLVLGLCSIGLVSLQGCAVQSPERSALIAGATIGELIEGVSAAQLAGSITVERESELLDHLQFANDELRRASRLIATCQEESDCGNAVVILRLVEAELARIAAALHDTQEPTS